MLGGREGMRQGAIDTRWKKKRKQTATDSRLGKDVIHADRGS
jgi:hypothetical protein